MLRNGRDIDNNFSGNDKLYRRVNSEDILGNRLIPTRIAYRNTSVNWSKYSKPWDVIFDYPQWGYCQLLVKHLPSELPKAIIQGANQKLHSFVANHQPIEENYAHTEIVTYKDGIKMSGNFDLPSIVKKEFRQIISDRSIILSKPKVN